jgi:hypothetical protein
MKTKSIKTLNDIAALSPDEFTRFIPDLIVWHEFAKEALSVGFALDGLEWNDDGRQGVITHVDVTVGYQTHRVEID